MSSSNVVVALAAITLDVQEPKSSSWSSLWMMTSWSPLQPVNPYNPTSSFFFSNAALL
jgi:hypothetical protein